MASQLNDKFNKLMVAINASEGRLEGPQDIRVAPALRWDQNTIKYLGVAIYRTVELRFQGNYGKSLADCDARTPFLIPLRGTPWEVLSGNGWCSLDSVLGLIHARSSPTGAQLTVDKGEMAAQDLELHYLATHLQWVAKWRSHFRDA
ncbi:hypothetical protein NDU88_005248 [Pleurodeles waltl]|uniref:Uncharacterized protein n=1 Tax=Pleurodeles waltl TaxID=8319 RepID=A0AAV7MYP8_PLEWA|nr:hypothetical protein NDU88_005248 [Pleurodeles waltl]